MAVADGIIAAGAMASAVIEAAAFFGSSQVVAQLVDAHGVVYGSSPDTLRISKEVIRLFDGGHPSRSSKKASGLHALCSLPGMCLTLQRLCGTAAHACKTCKFQAGWMGS